ncbi:MAG: translation initiation factor IF-3 [Candidatus Omnitrophota bacterium]
MSKFVKINGQIRASEVRLIGPEGQKLGVMSNAEAMRIAKEEQLDLVEVSAQAVPPVCRVMDYTKFKYDQQKKDRESKKKQKVVHVKELRFKPKIGEHDYLVKLRNLEKFLKHHDKVKVSMTFRGRENTHKEFGEKILNRLILDAVEFGEPEKPPIQEGRNIIIIFKPKQ